MTTLDTRTWPPAEAALADLILSSLTEENEDIITIRADLLAGMMAAMSTAIVAALVDPAWARTLIDRLLTDTARQSAMPLDQVRLEEWEAARAYIADHPLGTD